MLRFNVIARLLIISTYFSGVYIYNIKDYSLLQASDEHDRYITQVAFSPDCQRPTNEEE